MDFRQRLEQGSRIRKAGDGAAAVTEDSFISPFYGTDRNSSPACLELRMPGGIRKALPYCFFTGVNFDIDSGIEILTTGKRIIITGRNLIRLFDHLVAYRVRYIQVNLGKDAGEDGLFVEEIEIEEAA